MNETSFVESRKDAWARLHAIVGKASRSVAGCRLLDRTELRELGELYRRTCSDLAYARAQRAAESITGYLNDLVGAAHGLLYATDRKTWRGLRRFVVQDFPQTFRKRLPFFWAAALCTGLGAIIAYGLVAASPSNVDYFVPPGHMLRDSLDVWVSGDTTRDASDPESVAYASALMTNNIQVSFTAFAVGILGGVLTVLLLMNNGMVLGAFAAMVGHAGKQGAFWAGVLPHGVVEMSEMLIAGAAGLSLGWALLAPGRRRRRDALIEAARDAARLVVGGVLLLVYAGLTEGFLSHAPVHPALKVAIGLLSGMVLYTYLFRSGRRSSTRQDAA